MGAGYDPEEAQRPTHTSSWYQQRPHSEHLLWEEGTSLRVLVQGTSPISTRRVYSASGFGSAAHTVKPHARAHVPLP